MGENKELSKWGMAEGWARRSIVTLVSLLIIGASSYIVSKAINAPSAAEVNTMIKTEIAGSQLMTRGAQEQIDEIAKNSIGIQQKQSIMETQLGAMNSLLMQNQRSLIRVETLLEAHMEKKP